jgi:hypothetical protein
LAKASTKLDIPLFEFNLPMGLFTIQIGPVRTLLLASASDLLTETVQVKKLFPAEAAAVGASTRLCHCEF